MSYIPPWAGSGRTATYNELRNSYNAKAANKRRYHAGLSRALEGVGVCNIVAVTDSLGIGYNGSVATESMEFPRRADEQVRVITGALQGGSGINCAVAAPGIHSDRWATSGTVDFGSLVPGCASLYANATLTFTSRESGNIACLYYSNLSTPFTVSIDGGAGITVTPTGADSSIAQYKVTGLTFGTHTIKVTALTNWAFIMAAMVDYGAGTKVHNIGLGGSRAGNGDYTNNWTDTSGNTKAIATGRKGVLTAAGVTDPDLVIVNLGANDMQNGGQTQADNAYAGIKTIFGWWPNATKILTSAMRVGIDTTEANWDIFKEHCYDIAEELDLIHVDWQDKNGAWEEYLANGLAGADGIHPKNGVAVEWGRNLGQLLAA